MNYYSVHDRIASIHLTPFLSTNDETAKRDIRTVLSDPKHLFTQNAQDYCLVHLATTDFTSNYLNDPDPVLTYSYRKVAELSDILTTQEKQS